MNFNTPIFPQDLSGLYIELIDLGTGLIYHSVRVCSSLNVKVKQFIHMLRCYIMDNTRQVFP